MKIKSIIISITIFPLLRFNRMLDACDVPEETRKNMYGRTIARVHGIKSVHGFPVD